MRTRQQSFVSRIMIRVSTSNVRKPGADLRRLFDRYTLNSCLLIRHALQSAYRPGSPLPVVDPPGPWGAWRTENQAPIRR
jgi:hypothetical protein